MGRQVDRYELLEEVGSGGMAVVWRGRDTALDREVAVKLLHPHLAARREARARFSREARAVARLSHPHIVEIFDFAGEAAVESYLVTEFIRGRTLRAFAEDGGFGHPELGALVARALADALVHAHAAGVVHRDLKPENVLVVEGGRPALKLVDFGIARLLAADDQMTMTGALVGSPSHMAPEIIEGREADARSDLFSLGTILYWLTTGQLPFSAPNPTATLRRVLEGDFRDPREVSELVSDRLAATIRAALAVDPDQRTPSALVLRDELDAALAEAGIADPEEELRRFLADPATYAAAYPARLVAALTAAGEAALEAGATARALKVFDRVLATEPGNARVAEHLARLARSGRRRRIGRGVAAALLVTVLAAVATATALRSRRGRPAPDPAPSAAVAMAEPDEQRAAPPPPAPPPPPLAAPPPGPPRVQDAAQRAATPEGAKPSPAATPQLESTLAVLVRPYAQRALLDGVEVASGAQRVVFTLSPGRAHRVRIEHACCEPFVREFPATAVLPPETELRVPLTPRPARLRVEAEPDARVLVDGRLVGRAGESLRKPLAVAMPANGANPYEGVVELRIEAPGRPAHVTTAKLRAGAELNVVVPRAVEPQPPPEEEVVDAEDSGAAVAEDRPASAAVRAAAEEAP